MLDKYERETVLQVAREAYAYFSGNDIDIDDDAKIAGNPRDGYWVQAWVWIDQDKLHEPTI